MSKIYCNLPPNRLRRLRFTASHISRSCMTLSLERDLETSALFVRFSKDPEYAGMMQHLLQSMQRISKRLDSFQPSRAQPKPPKPRAALRRSPTRSLTRWRTFSMTRSWDEESLDDLVLDDDGLDRRYSPFVFCAFCFLLFRLESVGGDSSCPLSSRLLCGGGQLAKLEGCTFSPVKHFCGLL
jgi:hypothetical protein